VIIREDVIVRPSYGKDAGKKLKYVRIKIGSYVYIDRGSIVSAGKIGNNVHIGKNCVIGHRTNIKDNVKILDNSVIPSDSVLPPFSVWGGRPALYMGELPESFDKFQQDFTITYFKNFKGQNMNARPGEPSSSFVIPQNTHRVLAEQELEQAKQPI